jgi:hypothetical protein
MQDTRVYQAWAWTHEQSMRGNEVLVQRRIHYMNRLWADFIVACRAGGQYNETGWDSAMGLSVCLWPDLLAF